MDELEKKYRALAERINSYPMSNATIVCWPQSFQTRLVPQARRHRIEAIADMALTRPAKVRWRI